MFNKSLFSAITANVSGVGITVLIQLLSVPIFLYYWDINKYGVWLMLTAIPSYLSMADIGIVKAVTNKMVMEYENNNFKVVNTLFHSALSFLLICSFFISIVVIFLIEIYGYFSYLNFDKKVAIFALCVSVLLGFFMGLIQSVYTCSNQYAKGIVIGNVVRLFEWFGYIIGMYLGGSFDKVATLGLIARLTYTLIFINKSSKINPNITWGIGEYSLDEIRGIFKPSISFMIIPLSNALSFQMLTILVGALLGPSSVAVFNIYRTIARVTVQITGLFSHALWPTFSKLYASKASNQLLLLFKKSSLIGIMSSAVIGVLVFIFSQQLLGYWTNQTIEFDSTLMLLMLVYATINGFWHIPRVFLMATNTHGSLSITLLINSILILILAYIACEIYFIIDSVLFVMIFGELSMLLISYYLAYNTLKTNNFKSNII